MPSSAFLLKTLDEALSAFRRIYRHEILLPNGGEELYRKHRRRLLRLRAILGPLPHWLESSSTGQDYWFHISNGRSSYETRNAYLEETLAEPVRKRVEEQASLSPEDYFAQRDWLVEGELGSGGSGRVLKVRHADLEWTRAIKVFDPAFYDGDQKILRRFFREAELLSQILHPTIVRLFEAGIAGDRPFLITEYIDGRNLEQVLQEKGKLSQKETVGIGLQLLGALSAVHEAGAVHRDIKPSNIMRTDEAVRLVDFGSGTFSMNRDSSRLTTHAVGTVNYVAPELFDDPSLIDPRTDLYSVAVTLSCLLAGRPISNPRSYLSSEDVFPELVEVLATNTDPIESRHESAAEFKKALANLKLPTARTSGV